MEKGGNWENTIAGGKFTETDRKLSPIRLHLILMSDNQDVIKKKPAALLSVQYVLHDGR
jgi:hypothetical protein